MIFVDVVYKTWNGTGDGDKTKQQVKSYYPIQGFGETHWSSPKKHFVITM